MSRVPRQQQWRHRFFIVINRRYNREVVFQTDEDRAYFLELLERCRQRFPTVFSALWLIQPSSYGPRNDTAQQPAYAGAAGKAPRTVSRVAGLLECAFYSRKVLGEGAGAGNRFGAAPLPGSSGPSSSEGQRAMIAGRARYKQFGKGVRTLFRHPCHRCRRVRKRVLTPFPAPD
jgi:hypothetical protein